MEEIIEQLRAQALPQTVAIDLPDLDQLVEIEEQLLLPIPFQVKQFLLTVSDVVFGSLEPVTASDPALHTHLPEVAAQAWADGLPRDLLPLCQVGTEYYCVNQNGDVHLWRDGEIQTEYWEDVWYWVRDVWLNS